MVRLASALLVLSLALGPAAPAEDPDLAAGIGLVQDGDFEGALLRLDAAVRHLEAAKAPAAALAKAYLYLGICYLELDQEATTRGKFREALRHDPVLRLDPRHFSPQVIRVFEAVRQETAPPPAAGAPARSTPATTPAAQKKKRSATPILLIAGGGAAAAGIAIAAGGGGSGSPVTTLATTTTTTTTATTTTTTTTTTTQPGSKCSYTITPAQVTFTKDGGNATCQVRTSANCSWNAESTRDWLTIVGNGNGKGNGTIRFEAGENKDNKTRTGQIRLRQERSVRCDVVQTDDNLAEREAMVVIASELALSGGSGQLVLNATTAAFQGAGRRELMTRAERGEVRIEATIVAASGAPGTWRFELAGTRKATSLRVLAGDVVQLTSSAVVFRLQGRSGERLVVIASQRP